MEEIKKQDGRKNNGGVRLNSGRKPSEEKLKDIKKQFREYFTEQDVEEIMAKLKKQMDEKPELLRLTIEQLFGKAPQSLNIDMNATVAIGKLESDLKEILDDKRTVNNSELSEETLQDGGGQTDDAYREPMSDIPVDSQENEAESMVERTHEIREILDGSVSSIDESK